MAQDVDLSSREWTDLIFEGKNKEFGAYKLRQDSPRRHTKAVVIVLAAIAVIAIALFLTISGVFATAEEEVDAQTEMTAVDVGEEIPEEIPDEVQPLPDIPEPEPEPVQEEDEVTNTQQLTEILKVENVDKEKEIKTQDEIIDNTAAIGTKTNDGIDDLTKAAVKHEIVEEKPKEVEKPKYEEPVNMAMVEQKPLFPGGDAAMYKWLSQNINYPAQASEEGISGKVYIQFVVEKDGSITNAQVARSKHQALDAEALRVVKKMPRWTPGRNNGQPVRVTYILPVTFKFQ